MCTSTSVIFTSGHQHCTMAVQPPSLMRSIFAIYFNVLIQNLDRYT